jgi:hypothetical protein
MTAGNENGFCVKNLIADYMQVFDWLSRAAKYFILYKLVLNKAGMNMPLLPTS